jgi:hypothetical protein
MACESKVCRLDSTMAETHREAHGSENGAQATGKSLGGRNTKARRDRGTAAFRLSGGDVPDAAPAYSFA